MHILFCLAVVCAHPIEEQVYDRTVSVRLTASAVVVDYVLEVSDLTAFNDTADLVSDEERPTITSRAAVRRAYLNGNAPLLAKTFLAEIDKKRLSFICKEKKLQVLDHLRCEYRFEAPWRLTAGVKHHFTFRDPNFDDKKGAIRLSLAAAPGVKLLARTQPDEALLQRKPLDLRPGDEERLRSVSAEFELPAPPPRPAEVKQPVPEADAEPVDGWHWPSSIEELVLSPGLGLIALLGAAFLGAVHALTPGHGKTMVAAYLVGEQGTAGHALLLGLVTTLTHTGIVLLVAAVFPLLFPGVPSRSMQAALVFGGGLLIAAAGFWLLLLRLSGKADHFHLIGGHHHHHHDHDHHHLPPDRPVTLGNLILLGIGGGLVPCGDAIALFGLCVKWQRPQLAFPLVLAFSVGLASVLVAIGLGVVWGQRFSFARWGDSPRLQRVVRVLPVVSAVMVTAVGLWMCYDGVHSGSG